MSDFDRMCPGEPMPVVAGVGATIEKPLPGGGTLVFDEHGEYLRTDPACMVCDLYRVIDRHLAAHKDDHLEGLLESQDAVADLVADLVTILPPRGHGLHDLATLQAVYTGPLEDTTAAMRDML